MRSPRVLFAALALVLIAGGVFLIISLRSDREAEGLEAGGARAPDREAAPTPVSTSGGAKRRPELRESDDSREPRERPRLEGSDGRSYVREDGTVVRDHRSGSPPPAPEEAPRADREVAPVEPRLVLGVRRALRPIVRECVGEHGGDLGEKPRLRAELAVAVEGGQLEVTGAEIQLKDAREGGVDACVHNQSLGMTLPAEDHPDVERHVLTYPFDL